jgi:hypothetical protein
LPVSVSGYVNNVSLLKFSYPYFATAAPKPFPFLILPVIPLPIYLSVTPFTVLWTPIYILLFIKFVVLYTIHSYSIFTFFIVLKLLVVEHSPLRGAFAAGCPISSLFQPSHLLLPIMLW